MKGVFCLVVLVSAAAAAHIAPPPTRIVGGEPTTIEEYPSLVAVESRGVFSGIWSQSCAGSILTSRVILSAAHCFAGITFDISNRRSRAGTTYRNTGGQVSNAVRVANHPQYNLIVRDYDISCLWIDNPLVWNPVVQAATIVAHGTDLFAGLPVTTPGWGTLSSGGLPPNELHHVSKYVIDWELCRERYDYLTSITPGGNFPVTERMVCAGILDVGGKDACQGDSGGPVYYIGETDKIVVGVVSWGWGCANKTYPGINANVASLADWIIETVESN